MSTNVDEYGGSSEDSLGEVYDEAAGLILLLREDIQVDELYGLIYLYTGKDRQPDDLEQMLEELERHELVERKESDTVPRYDTSWFDVRDHMNIMEQYGLSSTEA